MWFVKFLIIMIKKKCRKNKAKEVQFTVSSKHLPLFPDQRSNGIFFFCPRKKGNIKYFNTKSDKYIISTNEPHIMGEKN